MLDKVSVVLRKEYIRKLYLKANLADVEATVTLNNVGSVNRNLQRSEKLRLLLQNQRVKRLY